MSIDRQILPKDPQAGVCLHITSLPGRYGIGELGAAAFRFIDALAQMNLHVWQFLPTGPTAYGNSPYQPLSAFAGNELLIDTDWLIRAGLLKTAETDGLRKLSVDKVDYSKIIPLKLSLLMHAASRFDRQAGSDLKSDFDDFLETNNSSWLEDYAVFRLLKTHHGEQPWPAWQAPFIHRERKALESFGAANREHLEFLKIIQFLFHHQWLQLREYAQSRRVALFGDMPIYIALDSADAWASPEILNIGQDGAPDSVAGVPPDYFSADGQLWGNPLYDWTHHAQTGFAWWIERVRHAASRSNLVRIDHFRGLESYWAIPADATTARPGEWRAGPGDAFFTALLEALGHLPIVAEDLGVITPEVEALRDKYGLPGMRVLQFDVLAKNFSVDEIPINSICYTGTHDNDTTVGWFDNLESANPQGNKFTDHAKSLLRSIRGTPDTIHWDLIKLAFASPARIAIVPMQDYLGLGSNARLNTPGTANNNWQWRLQDWQLSPQLLDAVGELVSSSGRETWTPGTTEAGG